MELAVKTLEREIKALQPYKGKKLLYGGIKRSIDEVIKEHQSAIDLIKIKLKVNTIIDKIRGMEKSDEICSSLKSEIKKIADDLEKEPDSSFAATIQKFSNNS